MANKKLSIFLDCYFERLFFKKREVTVKNEIIINYNLTFIEHRDIEPFKFINIKYNLDRQVLFYHLSNLASH